MKVIVTIPAYNEEENIAAVIREIPRRILGVFARRSARPRRWLARPHRRRCTGGRRRLCRSPTASTAASPTPSSARLTKRWPAAPTSIVNTDADNHYDQTRIPDLIAPILHHEADIVVGSRMLERLKMRWANKQGNRVANFVLQRMLGIPGVDVSSGYRAYSREAALSPQRPLRPHLHARNAVQRPRPPAAHRQPAAGSAPRRPPFAADPRPAASRLACRPRHPSVDPALSAACRLTARSASIATLAGTLPFLRFLYFFAQGDGQGHLQSLIAGSVLLFLGVQFIVFGMLATAISWNRQLLEEVLYRLKDDAVETPQTLPASFPLAEKQNGRAKAA